MKPMYRTPPKVMIGIAIFVALILPSIGHAQVTVGLLPLPFCGSVSPNTIGAKIQTNISGTSTPLNTYTDSTGTTPNQNPVTLTGNSMQVWGISGNLYRLIVMDQNSVQQCVVDSVSPIGGGGGGGSANWSSLLPGTNNNSGTFIANGNGWDFSLANLFKAPVAAGILLSAPGSFGYDSSGNKWQFFQNGSQVGFGMAGSCGANLFVTALLATTTPTCTQPSAANLSNGVTGSGAVALASGPTISTPTLTTPTIGSGAGNITMNGGFANGTGFQIISVATGTIASGNSAHTYNWPTTWASTSYVTMCSVLDSTGQLLFDNIETQTTTQVTVAFDNASAGALSGTLMCIGAHQ